MPVQPWSTQSFNDQWFWRGTQTRQQLSFKAAATVNPEWTGLHPVRPLTLFTLDGSVVPRFLESDVPQVQNSGYDLKHHGAVLSRDAHHIHGVLGKQREGHHQCGSARGFTCYCAAGLMPSRRSHCAFAAKHKQEEICGENREERQGKRGRRPKDNNKRGTAWFVKRVGGYNIPFEFGILLSVKVLQDQVYFFCRIAANRTIDRQTDWQITLSISFGGSTRDIDKEVKVTMIVTILRIWPVEEAVGSSVTVPRDCSTCVCVCVFIWTHM